MPLLLDTSVAIELLDEVPRTIKRVADIDGQFLSVISWIELEAGVYRDSSRESQRRVRLDGFLQQTGLLNFSAREVMAYSLIIASQGFSRRLVSDRMIAATALSYRLTLATLNARDFRNIPGLTIEDWSA
ncbi:MAG TPA: PIN domain-containing protein [Sphingomicrobium sp.]|nr:PIN domain-containing protein [Sphingomicrobium sp.]